MNAPTIEIKHRVTGAVLRTVEAANLYGANLYGANLESANLYGAKIGRNQTDAVLTALGVAVCNQQEG